MVMAVAVMMVVVMAMMMAVAWMAAITQVERARVQIHGDQCRGDMGVRSSCGQLAGSYAQEPAVGLAAASAASGTAASSSWSGAAALGLRRMRAVAHGVAATAMVLAMAIATRAVEAAAEDVTRMVAGEVRAKSERYKPVAAIR